MLPLPIPNAGIVAQRVLNRDSRGLGNLGDAGGIRRQVEEGSGKLEAPSPPEGAGPQLEENPATVDEDPSPELPRHQRLKLTAGQAK